MLLLLGSQESFPKCPQLLDRGSVPCDFQTSTQPPIYRLSHPRVRNLLSRQCSPGNSASHPFRGASERPWPLVKSSACPFPAALDSCLYTVLSNHQQTYIFGTRKGASP